MVMSGDGNQVTLGSLTHVGMKRASNEDSHCAMVGANSPSGTDALLAVADGMGGHQAGEVASAMAINGILSRLSINGSDSSDKRDAAYYERLLPLVVREANSDVVRGAINPANRGMGTTLTVALLLGSRLMVSHVGDSRAYLLRDGELLQVTRDHSWVAEEVARGALTPEQARDHPRRNVLTRALGAGTTVDVDGTIVDVRVGDVVLLCSDGLHGLVTDGEIEQRLSTEEPQRACELLVARANELGGHDNVTVVVARIDRLGGTQGDQPSARDVHQQTTIRFKADAPARGRAIKVMKMLALPVWLPIWVLVKLARLMKAKGK